MSALSDLQHEVVELKRQVEELTSLLNTARAAGLDDLIAGHGYQQYGAEKNFRIDSSGIQIRHNAAAEQIAIRYLEEFQKFRDLPVYPVGIISGGDGVVYVAQYGNLATQLVRSQWLTTSLGLDEISYWRTTVESTGLPDGFIEVRVDEGSGTSFTADVTTVTLAGDTTVTADSIIVPTNNTPSSTQGAIRYDNSDDAFMGNVNGTEKFFAMEPGTLPGSLAMLAFFFGA